MRNICDVIKERRAQQARAYCMLRFGDLVLAVESQNKVWQLNIEAAQMQQQEFARNVVASTKHLSGLDDLSREIQKRKAAKAISKPEPVNINPEDMGVSCAG